MNPKPISKISCNADLNQNVEKMPVLYTVLQGNVLAHLLHTSFAGHI